MSLEALTLIEADPRRHRLVRALREAIITGGFKPGDRLVERDISERVGISRGPVREALRQLEQEGLVASFPYRGTEVTGVSQKEVEGVLVPIRLVLERFAFRHALPAMTERDFQELEQIVKAMHAATKDDDLSGVVDADVKFHELIFARADQPHCTQVWNTIVPRVRAYFYRDAPRHTSLSHIAEEHQELLESMRTREMEKVQPVLDRHILETIYLNENDAEGADSHDRIDAALEAVKGVGGKDTS